MIENKTPAHGGNRERATETAAALASASISCINSTTTAADRQGMIEAILPHGAENAVPARVLAEHFGFRSVRQLQKAVEAERRHGAIILTQTGGGYYRPAEGEEGQEGEEPAPAATTPAANTSGNTTIELTDSSDISASISMTLYCITPMQEQKTTAAETEPEPAE